MTPTIGLIANPVSARDIRRIVANAGNLQITDRVNIVQEPHQKRCELTPNSS